MYSSVQYVLMVIGREGGREGGEGGRGGREGREGGREGEACVLCKFLSIT